MKYIFFPFSLIFALITGFRNFLYDKKFIKSTKFEFPIINIGNLSTGGTGKTPHTDYLIQLLKPVYNVAVLSRGYKRATKGYQEVFQHSEAKNIGDEPLFYKWKHPNIKVSVCEDRVFGISAMSLNLEEKYVYLLDDAFQHRAIRAGLNIVLTDYHQRFTKDFVLPLGNLRESKKGIQRADIIIVTKCPSLLSENEKKDIVAEIQPKKYQFVFFSSMKYRELYSVFNLPITFNEKNTTALLVSGIANPQPLIDELESRFQIVHTRSFDDHYNFKKEDIESIIRTFQNIDADNKTLIVTEKDATRLIAFKSYFINGKIDIVCVPIEVEFDEKEKLGFNKVIKHYLNITLPIEIEEKIKFEYNDGEN